MTLGDFYFFSTTVFSDSINFFFVCPWDKTPSPKATYGCLWANSSRGLGIPSSEDTGQQVAGTAAGNECENSGARAHAGTRES